jgi:dihydrofolate reductase
VKGNIAAEMRKMKQEPGRDMVILGSGSIVSQLAQEGLIDEYQIVVNPIVLGAGRTMFEGYQGEDDAEADEDASLRALSNVFENTTFGK